MWTAYLLSLCIAAGGDVPAYSWLQRDLGLAPRTLRQLTLNELRCAVCHTELGAAAPPGPRLDGVGARLAPANLARFLAAPNALQPGTRMPDVLAQLPEDEREDAARALVHFLCADAPAAATSTGPHAPEELARGRELFHSVGCVACHGPLELAALTPPPAARANDEDDDEVDEDDGAGLSDETDESETSVGADESDTSGAGGASHEVNAGSKPQESWTPPPGLVSLDHVGAKYLPAGLAAFLFEPLHTRPAGRMPDLALSRAEAQALASYLAEVTSGDAGSRAIRAGEAFRVDPHLAARGAALFESLRCATCHEHGGSPSGSAASPNELDELVLPNDAVSPNELESPSKVAPPNEPVSRDERVLRFNPVMSSDRVRPIELGALDRGCVAATADPDHRGPWYPLDAAARDALSADASGADRARPDTDEESIERALAAFQCYACHAYAERGGVPPALDPFFRTTQPDLGDEARIPPPLTHVGAKLQGDWLRGVMFDGARVRPYMTTRMPSFGEANLAPLVDALLRVDRAHFAPYSMPVPTGDDARDAREAGRELLGTKGLGCVTCHDFNGTPSPGFRGLDLITIPERLQPAWFARFCVAPQSLRPGIVMPESWPGSVAVHQRILGGDTDAQLRAIWYFLTQGRTAADPPGIRPEPTFLAVEGQARVYRGRSQVAGFRGFAVGSTEGLHYAFDSEVGALTALWRGDFVSVRWDGQGAGEFRPRAEAAHLHHDLGVARLGAPDAPWPTRPARTKEAPRDTVPLYVLEHGYRFLGYRVDASGAPTFCYASGAVTIEERSEALALEGRDVLRRTLMFDTPEATTLHLRVVAAEFTVVSSMQLATPRIAIELPAGARLLPREDAVLELDLPLGRTSMSIDYELRR